MILEWISRRHEYPQRIELQAFEALRRHEPVPIMRGVETAAEQPDVHARGVRR
jgi:hypothetical protein